MGPPEAGWLPSDRDTHHRKMTNFLSSKTGSGGRGKMKRQGFFEPSEGEAGDDKKNASRALSAHTDPIWACARSSLRPRISNRYRDLRRPFRMTDSSRRSDFTGTEKPNPHHSEESTMSCECESTRYVTTEYKDIALCRERVTIKQPSQRPCVSSIEPRLECRLLYHE